MHHKDVAAGLSNAQRALLIEHVDGGAFVPAPISVRLMARRQTTESLQRLGLLRLDGYKSPKSTSVTDDGRMVMALVLAEYADALMRAGYVVREAVAAPAIAAVAALLNERPKLEPAISS